MSLAHVPLDQISEAHLSALIEARASETLHIEYKQQTYGGNDEARREFLADVSSFANSRGGDLLIGVVANNGIPTSLLPFSGNADAEVLRLENMARAGLEPRIPNFQIRPVPIANGGSVLVLRIPRSYRAPHRVVFGRSNRFWARSSAGKYEPNMDELRALFAFAPELAERMRAFRFERVAAIAARDTPVPLVDDCCLILHVVPFSHFDLRPSVSLAALQEHAAYLLPIGVITHPIDWRINFDGLLTVSNPTAGVHRAYVQAFRAGAVEAVASSIGQDNGQLDVRRLDAFIVHYTRVYAMLLKESGGEPPFIVMASIIGAKGRMLGAFDQWRGWVGQSADRAQLHLTEIVLGEVPAGDPHCGQALRPLLDQLANAAGIPSSPNFDEHGNYMLR
ncbi:MAG: ATP-binding protein [Deltaproteobacteria bacterium]|nr:ATP-binding protein [Deltaproteobacteria bacterium]